MDNSTGVYLDPLNGHLMKYVEQGLSTWGFCWIFFGIILSIILILNIVSSLMHWDYWNLFIVFLNIVLSVILIVFWWTMILYINIDTPEYIVDLGLPKDLKQIGENYGK